MDQPLPDINVEKPKCQREGCTVTPYKGNQFCGKHSEYTKQLRKETARAWRQTPKGKECESHYYQQAIEKRRLARERRRQLKKEQQQALQNTEQPTTQ